MSTPLRLCSWNARTSHAATDLQSFSLHDLASALLQPHGLPWWLRLNMEAISNPNDDKSTNIVAAVATVTSVAAVVVGARLYVRTYMIRSFGWDVSCHYADRSHTWLTLIQGRNDHIDDGCLNRRLCIDSCAGQ